MLRYDDCYSVNAALAVEIMEGLAAALYPDMSVQQVALPLVIKAEMMVSFPSRIVWNKNIESIVVGTKAITTELLVLDHLFLFYV